jgi:hypothetical protein
MNIDKTLLTIAEEFKFKVIKDKIFGVFERQYFCIQRTQNGYLLRLRLKNETRSILEGLNQNNGIIKAIGLKRGNAEFINGHLLITGIGNHFSTAKLKAKILETLKNITELLSKHQNFPNPQTDNTILVEDIPTPDDERLIQEAEVELLKKATKPIDYAAGLFLGLVCSLGFGVVLGFFSWLMQKYTQQDINPLGKGFLATVLIAGIYIKISGGLDKKSRPVVLGLSVLTFVIWDLAILFFHIYDRRNEVFTIERLVEIYQEQILKQSAMGNYAVLAIGTIIVGSFLFIKRTDRTKLVILGRDLNSEKSIVNYKKIKKLENRFGVCIGIGFVITLSSIFLNTTIVDRFYFFSFTPFFILGGGLYILFLALSHLVIRNIELVKFVYFQKDTPSDVKLTYWAILALLNLFLPVSICNTVSYFNVKYDQSHEYSTGARTLESFTPNNNKCNSIRFEAKDYGELKEHICLPQAGLVEKGELLELKSRKGYFSIPYFLEMNFPNLNSYKRYVESRGNESNFRSNVIRYFYATDKSEHFKQKLKEWESHCTQSPGPKCRLRAYIHEVDKNHLQALKLLKAGCAARDPVSCRGVYFNDVATNDDKQQMLALFKENCESKKEDYCIEWAYTLWNASYEKNQSDIKRIFDESCKRGYEKACGAVEGM